MPRSRKRYRFIAAVVVALSAAVGVWLTAPWHKWGTSADPESTPPPKTGTTKTGEVFLIEGFDDKVTRRDLGANAFAGNCGLIESTPGFASGTLLSRGPNDWCYRIAFDFRNAQDDKAFAGMFHSLFGPSGTKISLDGSGVEPKNPTPFPGYYLNTRDIFGGVGPWKDRSVEELRLDVKSEADKDITLKIELKDAGGQVTFTRERIRGKDWQTLRLSLPGSFNTITPDTGTFDWTRVRMLTLVVEHIHVAEGVRNPDRSALLLDNIRLVDLGGEYPNLDAMRGNPEHTPAFLEHLRAMCFLYFTDFAGRDKACGGIVQDRAIFADLLSTGGAGFQLTGYVIGAESQYLTRADAAERTLRVLRVLHGGPQGPDRVGTTGYRGFFYHFLGTNGRRKQNFDFDATRDVNEALNTVELSTIDTALCLCGVLTAGEYFRGDDESEQEIRRLAAKIYERVDWPFMLDRQSNQFFLGWKPNETREDNKPGYGRFLLPDPDGRGHYSSKPAGGVERPATLDYFTDEGLLLACAAPNPQFRADPSVFFSMIRDGDGFVKTFPGSLFTYQFAGCWLDTKALGADRDPAGKARPVDYFANARAAIGATIDYSRTNPNRRASLSEHRWGLSACEGPFGDYFAETAPPAALAKSGGFNGTDGRWHEHPLERGTLTVYAAGCSLQHTPDESVAALWECQRLGLLHPRFGFADAFNLDIGDVWQGGRGRNPLDALRTSGPWKQTCGFAIDHGPMLVILDNHLAANRVPRLFMNHPRIRETLKTLFPDGKW